MNSGSWDLARRLDLYFELSKRGSSLKTEILAGVTYVFECGIYFHDEPSSILGGAGFNVRSVLLATVFTTSVTATIVMALWVRLPLCSFPVSE